jgi:hypothetical protein
MLVNIPVKYAQEAKNASRSSRFTPGVSGKGSPNCAELKFHRNSSNHADGEVDSEDSTQNRAARL